MKKVIKIILISLVFLSLSNSIFAETIILHSGKKLIGRVAEVTKAYLKERYLSEVCLLKFKNGMLFANQVDGYVLAGVYIINEGDDGRRTEYAARIGECVFIPEKNIIKFKLIDGSAYNFPYSKFPDGDSLNFKTAFVTLDLVSSNNVSLQGPAEMALDKGKKYFSRGNYDKAIAEFDKAIKIIPDSAEAYHFRGLIYYVKNNFTQAILDFNKAIELNPDYVRAYNSRAEVYNSKGDYNQAIADYSQAIALNNYYAKAYANRGALYYSNGSYDQALADLTYAIELKIDDAKVFYNRALVYYSKHNYNKAWADVHKAEKLGCGTDSGFLEKLKKASGKILDNETR